MAARHQAVDQCFVLGGEAIVQRAQVVIPLLLGAGTSDHRAYQ
jgi:hypothetical protein